MFSDEDRRTLNRLERGFATFRANELERDQRAAEKAKEVAARQIAALGGVADGLTELADVDDVAVLKKRISELKSLVLQHLADDPDVDGADNPAKVG